jgi:transcriptional regulator with XRE-family HTH domain
MAKDPDTLGTRVRHLREGRRWSRQRLAGEVGLSLSYITAIENGGRVPDKWQTIRKLSLALGSSMDDLLGHPFPIGDDGRPAHPAVPAVQDALEWRAALAPLPTALPDLVALESRVRAAWDAWQAPGEFSFGIVGAYLPDLIRDAEMAVRAHRGQPSERDALRTAAHLYLLVRAYLKWVGHRHLTPGIAERGLAYAEAVGDPALLGAAVWNYAQALTSTERPDGARALARRTLDLLEPDAAAPAADPRLLSAVGALHLVSTIAAARGDDPRDSYVHLEHAARYAARLGGDRNDFWLVFGPSNVAVHRVANQVEQGQPQLAVRGARQTLTLLDNLGSVERRVSLLTDAAYTLALTGDDDAEAAALLAKADEQSRERLIASAKARSTTTLLLSRASRSDRGRLLPLAKRLSVA